MNFFYAILFCVGTALTVGKPVSTITMTLAWPICSLPSTVSSLHIEILENSIVSHLPVLMYNGNGSCEWTLRITVTGFTINTGSDGHRLPLDNTVNTDLEATCIMDGTELLRATISTTGKAVDCY